MSTQPQRLFNLLPSLYRLRDAQLAQQNGFTPADAVQLQALQALPGPLTTAQQQQLDQLTALSYGPLQALLSLVEEQVAIVGEDLNQLYDNQFIETCAPWVIPYIGDLIGYQLVNGVAAAVASPRAEVANTISLRRRKGTVLVLEQLARDVTGWGAHAVEFFEVLADTQYMNHLRPWNHYAPDLRRWKAGDYMNSGFDRTAHKVDVRRIADERGRYNIQNIGIFLWSLDAYSVTLSPCAAVPGQPLCFRISTLGRDFPLFNNPISQGADITALATPENVPACLTRHVLCHEIRNDQQPNAVPVYYGPQNSLALYLGPATSPTLLDPAKLQVCDLAGPDGSWNNMPPSGGLIAIDPQLGRIALPPGTADTAPIATYYYGFNGPMGGGEYSRESSFTASPQQVVVRVPGDQPTISAALATLPGDGVVEVSDSGVYTEAAGLSIAVAANCHIELRAADGARPTLFLGAAISVTGGTEAAFDLNGFIIAFEPVTGGAPPPALLESPASSSNLLTHLGITNCTFVPGWALQPDGTPVTTYAGLPAVQIAQSGVALVVENSILGSLWIAEEATASLTNSVIDATAATGVAYVASIDPATQRPSAGGSLTLIGCTVIGKVCASLLTLVSDSIFWSALTAADLAGTPPLWSAALWSMRKQQGCVRFSFVPETAILPRNYECVQQADGQPQPLFYSLRYGDPGYAKLLPSTDSTIRQGADDGGEMGAFHFVLAPLREIDLRTRLQEYMPVNLEYGIFYEN
ncbi:MAG TPA: hypothetical protein VHX60_00980 [Acidobacteriaceae bacterium]|jgi:hypothetical protein|nr:hypothetical protein [Acidobacteriaceae bacterium]